MNIINLSPDALAAINSLLSARSICSNIVHLGNAEDALQKAAYEDDDLSYMFRFAYELKLMREELIKLENLLGYEPERD